MCVLVSEDKVVDEAAIWRIARSEHVRHIRQGVAIMPDLVCCRRGPLSLFSDLWGTVFSFS